MKNLIVRFYIEVTTISPIRETYPVATTTTADDTAIKTDFNIVYSLVKERRLSLILIDSIRHFAN
mgnify:FL=1